MRLSVLGQPQQNSAPGNLKFKLPLMNFVTLAKWLIILSLLINAAPMLSPVIDSGDAVTYASLAQHIAQNNDWSNLVLDGRDWLDKPHMPFWITALFFKLFGAGEFGYVLPGFIFHLIGGFFTYRIARMFYRREAAWLAVLVYVSAYDMMDSTIEVKAEVYLTGFVMGAVYYWLRYDARAKLKYLLLGALFSAGALMTKGIITLITISSGFVCLWLYRGQLRNLWSFKWLAAVVLTLLFATPEVAALYLQFDAHPEKVLFGQAHVSGVRFFLWDSQFGRFLNTGPIQNTNGHPLYFVLVFLWAFLPWVAVFIAALASTLRSLKSVDETERARLAFLGGAFFVTFAIFSATRFQMGYYLVILYPFAAIFCGKYLHDKFEQQAFPRGLVIAQIVLTALLAALSAGLAFYMGEIKFIGPMLLMLAAALALSYAGRTRPRLMVILGYPVFAVTAVYLAMALLTESAFTRYEIPYNANRVLANETLLPVYFYQMDPIDARALALYGTRPCFNANGANELPRGNGYFLIIRHAQLSELGTLHGASLISQNAWVIHKTGILPKLLKLARDGAGTEAIDILRVNP